VFAGRAVPEGARVVTFVASCLDRVRGFDRFVRLAVRLQRELPDALFVAVGDSIVTRGVDPFFHGQNYAEQVLREAVLPDPARFWLLGHVSPSVVGEVLAASDLHLYPTRSYPVGPSLLEALGRGCVVLASDVAPVREVLRDGVDGLLVPGSDEETWAAQASSVLREPAAYRGLGENASRSIQERYSRAATLPKLANWLQRLVDGES
jgi:glycosyltransferase involved in cell wall biosynthesis